MSNRDSSNDLNSQEKGAASSFLLTAFFRLWPFVLLALVVCWGYFDLRGQIEELQTQFAATPSPQSTGVKVQHAKSSIQKKPTSRQETNWNCNGAITREEVLDLIGREGHAVFRCYGERLAENPALKGTIDIRLHVNAAGIVKNMRLEGGALAMDAGFTECLWKSVSEWLFPAPGGGDCAVVSAPFILGPRNTEKTSTNESNGIPDSDVKRTLSIHPGQPLTKENN